MVQVPGVVVLDSESLCCDVSLFYKLRDADPWLSMFTVYWSLVVQVLVGLIPGCAISWCDDPLFVLNICVLVPG